MQIILKFSGLRILDSPVFFISFTYCTTRGKQIQIFPKSIIILYFPRSCYPTNKLIISFSLSASFLWMKCLSFVCLIVLRQCLCNKHVQSMKIVGKKPLITLNSLTSFGLWLKEKKWKKKNHHISLYFPQIDLIKIYPRNAAKNSGNEHKVYSAWMYVCMWRIYAINQEITEPYILS